MEGFDCTIFDGAARKKRSQISRRPRPESQPYPEFHDHSSLSSTPSLDDVSKVSSHENGFDTNPTRKELNLGQCFSPACAVGDEDEKSRMKNVENGLFTAVVNCEEGQSGNKPSGKGILASANRKNTSKVKAGVAPVTAGAEIYIGRKVESQNSGKYGGIAVGLGHENKVKKVVKLKVGGVTHTLHANSSCKISNGDMPSATNNQSSEASRLGQENPQQGDLWHDHYVPDRRNGLQGIRRKDSSHGGFNFRKEEPSMVKMSGKNTSGKVGDKLEPVRKSKRVPKRRMFNGEFGEEDDDEILYLEKLKMNVDVSYKEEEGPGKRQRELSKASNIESGSSKSVKYWRKKLGPERASDDMDFQEDEVLVSDGELESAEKQKKDSVDTSMDGKKEFSLTTSRRSLQSNKDGSSTRGSGLIEFPDGLPPAPSRKQKEKLSVVEEQLKKTEAAQRRRMQVEKAAKESQDEAIRKILGQDSGRKKREEKIKQRQEEIAQERAASVLKVAPNTIRCVNGPTGTVVTFSDDIVLSSIFDSKPRSYPPPRELCAGPSCANPYKYRHSKLGVPLCSLKCYKAVEEQMLTKTTN